MHNDILDYQPERVNNCFHKANRGFDDVVFRKTLFNLVHEKVFNIVNDRKTLKKPWVGTVPADGL